MCRDVVCPPLHAAGCLLPSFACMAGLPSSTAHARTQRPVFVPSMPIRSGTSNAPTCFAQLTNITHHAGGGGSIRSLPSTRHTSTCTDHRRTTRWAAVSSLAPAQSTPAVPCEPPTGGGTPSACPPPLSSMAGHSGWRSSTLPSAPHTVQPHGAASVGSTAAALRYTPAAQLRGRRASSMACAAQASPTT